MTWVVYDGNEPIPGSEHEDEPGMCMLFLMRSVPEVVGRDFLNWLGMRDSRAETAVRAVLDVAIADSLKEDYLAFVATCAVEVGYYNVLHSDFLIKEVTEDVES